MDRIGANTFLTRCTFALLSTLSIGAWAQTTHQVDVNRGTVVYVSGNDLVVKMEDGNLKHFVVPSDYKLTVDGKPVYVQDLKPGTKLTQTITTTTEERVGYGCANCKRQSVGSQTATPYHRLWRQDQARQSSRRHKVHGQWERDDVGRPSRGHGIEGHGRYDRTDYYRVSYTKGHR